MIYMNGGASVNSLIDYPAVGDRVEQRVLNDMQDPFSSMVFNQLSSPDLVRFSEACYQTHKWTRHEREVRASSCLMERVVKGCQEQAECILRYNPCLLLCTLGTAIDYSGKSIQNMTAFQAALCAGDVEMCQMMKPYFDRLESGQEHLKRQYDALFPEGIEAFRQEQAKAAFDFSTIIYTILKAPAHDVQLALAKQYDSSRPLHLALESFRFHFDEISHQEQIFNLHHLFQVYQHFDRLYDASISSAQADLIWCQVVGYTQRHLPAYYAQAFAQGLYYLSEKKEPLNRLLDFRSGMIPLYPLRAHQSDIGFDFGCSVMCGLATTSGGEEWVVCWRMAGKTQFLQFITHNDTELETLSFASVHEPFDTWCSIS